MDAKILSIAEYAKLKGISTSAVYKKLKTTLKPFCVVDNQGRKGLKSDVLGVFEEYPIDRSVGAGCRLVDNLTPYGDNFSSTVDNFSSTVDNDRQLKEKDSRIKELEQEVERLRAAIEEKDKYIMDTAKRVMDVLEQTAKLQENYQVLIARQQEVKQISDKKGFLRNIFHKANTPHQE